MMYVNKIMYLGLKNHIILVQVLGYYRLMIALSLEFISMKAF